MRETILKETAMPPIKKGKGANEQAAPEQMNSYEEAVPPSPDYAPEPTPKSTLDGPQGPFEEAVDAAFKSSNGAPVGFT